MPSIDLPSGGKLAFRESGTGPALILVHGSPGEGRSWARVAPHLAGHYRVLMPDLPGYGGSDGLTETPTDRTPSMGAAIAALIESCDAPVRLCGHSYGGNVALHAAVAQSARLSDLTLLEPVFFRALALAGERAVLEQASSFFTGYADRVSGGRSEAVSEMVDFWFGAGAYERLPSQVRSYLVGAASKNAIDVRASLGDTVARDRLASLELPVLVVYGAASPPVAPAIARALVSLLPQARLEAIVGASHGMLDSHPEYVARLLLGQRA